MLISDVRDCKFYQLPTEKEDIDQVFSLHQPTSTSAQFSECIAMQVQQKIR